MALLGYEGFDNEASGFVDLINVPFSSAGVWTFPGTGPSKVAGLLGGSAIGHGNSAVKPYIILNTNYTTLTVGFRLLTGNVLQQTDYLYFTDAGNVQCGLGVNATNKLVFFRNSQSTILATGPTTLLASSWYMVDVTLTVDPSSGSFSVNLGGISEISGSGNTRQTSNSFSNGVQFPGNNGSAIDDMYLLDNTGPSPFNAPLGVIRIETLFPTANNSVSWTPLASSNVSQVSETSMDGDTSYNFNTTTGIDTFTHGSLSSTPLTIYATSVVSAAKRTDVKASNYRNKLISGATTANGATNALATAYQYVTDYYPTDPNTGLAWTAAAVNATDIGYERF